MSSPAGPFTDPEGVKGRRRFRYYLKYSYTEAKKDICGYLIGFFTCILVIAACGYVSLIINLAPAIFIQQVEQYGNVSDITITSKHVRPPFSPLIGPPFINSTRIQEVLNTSEHEALFKNSIGPPSGHMSKYLKAPDLFQHAVPRLVFQNSGIYSNCETPSTTLFAESLWSLCVNGVGINLSFADSKREAEAKRTRKHWINTVKQYSESSKPQLSDPIPPNTIVITEDRAEALQVQQGDKVVIAVNAHEIITSYLTLYFKRKYATTLPESELETYGTDWELPIPPAGHSDRTDLDNAVKHASLWGEIRAELTVGAVVKSTGNGGGRIPHSHRRSVALMEFDYLLDLLHDSLDPALVAQVVGIQDMLKSLKTEDKSSNQYFSTWIDIYFPGDRLKLYSRTNFADMIRDLAFASGQLRNKLGPTSFILSTPVVQSLQNYEFGLTFISLILNLVLVALVILSVALIYSLLLKSSEAATMRMGILRMLGLPRSCLIELLLTQSFFYVIPGVVFGVLALVIGAGGIVETFRETTDVPIEGGIPSTAFVIQILVGIFVPILSSIGSIQAALRLNVRDALDAHRPKTMLKFTKPLTETRTNPQFSAPLFTAGFFLAILGFCAYYAVPLALLSMNLALFALVFLLVLIGMFVGLILLGINLQQLVARALSFIFLFWEDLRIRDLVLSNLKAHRGRNRKTALMYAGTLAAALFLLSSMGIETSTVSQARLRSMGSVLISSNPPSNPALVFQRLDKLKKNGILDDYTFLLTSQYHPFSGERQKTVRLSTIGRMSSDAINFYGIAPQYLEKILYGGVQRDMPRWKWDDDDDAERNLSTTSASRQIHTHYERRKWISLDAKPKQLANTYSVADEFDSGRAAMHGAVASNLSASESLYTVRGSSLVMTSRAQLQKLNIFPAKHPEENLTNNHVLITSAATVGDTRLSAASRLMIGQGLTRFPNRDNHAELRSRLPRQAAYVSIPTFLRILSSWGWAGVSARNINGIDFKLIVHDLSDKSRLKLIEDSLKDVMQLRNHSSEVDSLSGMDGGITLIFSLILVILLALCLFSLIASMASNITEQIPEIAILRSLGMTKVKIVLIYVYEALLLVFSSSFIGIGIGIFVGWCLVQQRAQHLEVDLKMDLPAIPLVLIFIAGIISAFISSFSPAKRLVDMSVSALNKQAA